MEYGNPFFEKEPILVLIVSKQGLDEMLLHWQNMQEKLAWTNLIPLLMTGSGMEQLPFMTT